MNKNELIAKIAEETGMTKADCARMLEATLDVTRKAIKKGDEVRLVGFGTFVRAKQAARKGRNPQTGKEISIKARWVPRFRAGKEFKEFVR
jgi:DNA-binding protein HU-beta